VDFEKRIAEIYQRCRSPKEIKASFDQLQLELRIQNNETMTRTRRQLLENFDQEVHDDDTSIWASEEHRVNWRHCQFALNDELRRGG